MSSVNLLSLCTVVVSTNIIRSFFLRIPQRNIVQLAKIACLYPSLVRAPTSTRTGLAVGCCLASILPLLLHTSVMRKLLRLFLPCASTLWQNLCCNLRVLFLKNSLNMLTLRDLLSTQLRYRFSELSRPLLRWQARGPLVFWARFCSLLSFPSPCLPPPSSRPPHSQGSCPRWVPCVKLSHRFWSCRDPWRPPRDSLPVRKADFVFASWKNFPWCHSSMEKLRRVVCSSKIRWRKICYWKNNRLLQKRILRT